MTARFAAVVLSVSALSLGGCDYVSSVGNDTEMKNVEILPGTASDEMVTLDSANGDGTAIDPSTAVGPATPKPDADDGEDGGTAASDEATGEPDRGEDGAAPAGDVVVRPPAGGAEPDRPATPTKK